MRRFHRFLSTTAAAWGPSVATGGALSIAAFCVLAVGCGTKEINGLGSPTSMPTPGAIDDGFVACGAGDAGQRPVPGMFKTESTPIFQGIISATEPPPPISGGSMVVLRDGLTVVAADADRDRVYVVRLAPTPDMLTAVSSPGAGTLRAVISLAPGDQPGRAVEDGAGLVHVALRGGGGLVTIDPAAGKITMRRPACALPRGLAYDAANDRLLVACAGGELLTFAPTAALPERQVKLRTDLRDVVIDGPRVLVTRFRSAETIVLDAQGALIELVEPVDFKSENVHGEALFSSSVAWRTVAMPGGGAVMVHQRGMRDPVRQTAGGYGGFSPCDTIVHTSVSRVKSGERPRPGPAMPGFVLPVDIAVSPDGKQIAMIAAGNGHAQFGARKLFVAEVADVTEEWQGGCGNDDKHGPATQPTCGWNGNGAGTGGTTGFMTQDGGVCPPGFILCGFSCEEAATSKCGMNAGGSAGATGIVDAGRPPSAADGGAGASAADGGAGASTANPATFDAGSGTDSVGVGVPVGDENRCYGDLPDQVEPVSVGFAGGDRVVVQTREPATLWILSKIDGTVSRVSLSQESRTDTGHAVFHSNSGGGLACASCHPEGHEDGRIWHFECDGRRRTQDLAGGLKGTEPFHWNGDLNDFPKLMDTVFSGRMSGPQLDRDQMTAALNWIDKVPARPGLRPPTDIQVQRGKAIFHSPEVGCATCHLGPTLTNNATVDVGTSAPFQVPSLRGLAWRAPYMHNGCSPTLAARFDDRTCNGGDLHGKTSQLTPAQLDDLVAFLESL